MLFENRLFNRIFHAVLFLVVLIFGLVIFIIGANDQRLNDFGLISIPLGCGAIFLCFLPYLQNEFEIENIFLKILCNIAKILQYALLFFLFAEILFMNWSSMDNTFRWVPYTMIALTSGCNFVHYNNISRSENIRYIVSYAVTIVFSLFFSFSHMFLGYDASLGLLTWFYASLLFLSISDKQKEDGYVVSTYGDIVQLFGGLLVGLGVVIILLCTGFSGSQIASYKSNPINLLYFTPVYSAIIMIFFFIAMGVSDIEGNNFIIYSIAFGVFILPILLQVLTMFWWWVALIVLVVYLFIELCAIGIQHQREFGSTQSHSSSSSDSSYSSGSYFESDFENDIRNAVSRHLYGFTTCSVTSYRTGLTNTTLEVTVTVDGAGDDVSHIRNNISSWVSPLRNRIHKIGNLTDKVEFRFIVNQ